MPSPASETLPQYQDWDRLISLSKASRRRLFRAKTQTYKYEEISKSHIQPWFSPFLLLVLRSRHRVAMNKAPQCIETIEN